MKINLDKDGMASIETLAGVDKREKETEALILPGNFPDIEPLSAVFGEIRHENGKPVALLCASDVKLFKGLDKKGKPYAFLRFSNNEYRPFAVLGGYEVVVKLDVIARPVDDANKSRSVSINIGDLFKK